MHVCVSKNLPIDQISLLANDEVSMFFLLYVCFYPINYQQQHKPEADVYPSISTPSALLEHSQFCIFYTMVKSNDNKASPFLEHS